MRRVGEKFNLFSVAEMQQILAICVINVTNFEIMT
jgi:hypothetical protein